jgi:hypothetical protein
MYPYRSSYKFVIIAVVVFAITVETLRNLGGSESLRVGYPIFSNVGNPGTFLVKSFVNFA